MFSRRTLLLGTAANLLPLWARERSLDWTSKVAGQTLYSESAYLDLVSDDGETGFIARIGRYPSLGRSWLWAHAFDRNGMYCFTTENGSSTSEATDLDRSDVEYKGRGDGARLRLLRRGPRSAPRHFYAEASFRGHFSDRLTTRAGGAHPPHGRGAVKVSLSALLRPGHPPASNLSGRTEVLGEGTAHLTIGGQTHSLSARGHFHEQTQERPRFVNPFVYATLRGEGFYSEAIRHENGSVGFAWIDDRLFQVTDFAIEAPQETAAGKRRYRLLAKSEPDGATRRIEAELSEQHLYSVPIYDQRRRGTIVQANLRSDAGTPGSHARTVSGCVNDHLSERLDYSM